MKFEGPSFNAVTPYNHPKPDQKANQALFQNSRVVLSSFSPTKNTPLSRLSNPPPRYLNNYSHKSLKGHSLSKRFDTATRFSTNRLSTNRLSKRDAIRLTKDSIYQTKNRLIEALLTMDSDVYDSLCANNIIHSNHHSNDNHHNNDSKHNPSDKQAFLTSLIAYVDASADQIKSELCHTLQNSSGAPLYPNTLSAELEKVPSKLVNGLPAPVKFALIEPPSNRFDTTQHQHALDRVKSLKPIAPTMENWAEHVDSISSIIQSSNTMVELCDTLQDHLTISIHQARQLAEGFIGSGESLGHTFESTLTSYYLKHSSKLGFASTHFGLIHNPKQLKASAFQHSTLPTFQGSTEIDGYLVNLQGKTFIIEMTMADDAVIAQHKPTQVAKLLQKFPNANVFLVAPNLTHSHSIKKKIEQKIFESLPDHGSPTVKQLKESRMERFKVFGGPLAIHQHLRACSRAT